MSTIPIPVFESCDETSIKIKWDESISRDYDKIKLQYKEVQEEWDQCKECDVSVENLYVDIDSSTGSLVDLNPG